MIYNVNLFGLNSELVFPVKQYMEVTAWSVFPVAVFVALKEFLQAWEKVIAANIIMLLMVMINLILDVVLTFGVDIFGIKIAGMGLLGLSVATLLSKTLSAVLILFYCLPLFKTPFEKGKNSE